MTQSENRSDLGDERLGAMVDALAPVLGIPVTPEFRPGIIANLRISLDLAALMLDFHLDEREEPAPVFRP